MKIIILLFSLLICLCINSESQNLIIKGKIKCMNSAPNSTKGAENIVVVPAFRPSHATITISQPSGYFEFNTGLPISRLQDKTITVYAVSGCATCRESAKRVFISEDQDRQNRNDTKHYVTIKDWLLNTNCKKAELIPFAADSVLNLVVKQPDQNLDNVTGASALVGAPAFLNFITTISPVTGVLANAGSFSAESLDAGKINYGNFLFSSPLSHSANTGFNFAPSRDISEAVFWNPSAIVFNNKPHNISLLTNLKNNVKLSGFYGINDKISLAVGGIYTFQDERRKSVFVRVPGYNPEDFVIVDSTKMNLKEYAIFLSPAFKVNDKFSLGLTLKSIWQNFNIPNELFIDINNNNVGEFSDSIVIQQRFDFDISATYNLTNSLQIGANLMNVAGTTLFADAFIPGQTDLKSQNLRSLGLGILYKWQRFNFGTDIMFTADGLYDATLGVNYVPFNNALLTAGFAVKQMSYSVAFRLKYFRIAYINDNNWLINERKKGKSEILNGKIYGGFIFDLN